MPVTSCTPRGVPNEKLGTSFLISVRVFGPAVSPTCKVVHRAPDCFATVSAPFEPCCYIVLMESKVLYPVVGADVTTRLGAPRVAPEIAALDEENFRPVEPHLVVVSAAAQ